MMGAAGRPGKRSVIASTTPYHCPPPSSNEHARKFLKNRPELSECVRLRRLETIRCGVVPGLFRAFLHLSIYCHLARDR